MEASTFDNPLLSTLEGCYSFYGGSIIFVLSLIFLIAILPIPPENKPFPGFKLYGNLPGDPSFARTKAQYATSGGIWIKNAYNQARGKAFQIITGTGPMILLPRTLIDEVRNNKNMTLSGFLEHEFLPDYPGLGPWKGLRNSIFQDVVKKNLTTAIGPLTPSLPSEMSQALEQSMQGVSDEWTPIPLLPTILPIAARMTTKVFTGDALCRDPDWLSISISFTMEASAAVHALRSWPSFSRPIVCRLLPEMRQIQQSYSRADKIVKAELKARQQAKRALEADGNTETRFSDALEWFSETAVGREYNVTDGQLLLSFAALHTTSMTLYAFMFDILSSPDIIPELRKEMIQVLTEDGNLTKQSLYKLKLLDSCLKESQRISNFGPTSLHRRVERPVTLSDGTHLPKGCITAFPTLVMHDPEIYGPDPLAFDGRRYLRLRQQPGQENRGQFVATSADHFGFGHGKFACPGRFMAANVLKIMIVHLLLRYDWKLSEVARKSLVESELRPDPSTAVLCKLRVSEFETFRVKASLIYAEAKLVSAEYKAQSCHECNDPPWHEGFVGLSVEVRTGWRPLMQGASGRLRLNQAGAGPTLSVPL